MKRILTILFVAMLVLFGTRGVVYAEDAPIDAEEMPVGLSVINPPLRVE